MIPLSKAIKTLLKLQQKTWHILLSLFHHLGDKVRPTEQVETLNFYVLVT